MGVWGGGWGGAVGKGRGRGLGWHMGGGQAWGLGQFRGRGCRRVAQLWGMCGALPIQRGGSCSGRAGSTRHVWLHMGAFVGCDDCGEGAQRLSERSIEPIGSFCVAPGLGGCGICRTCIVRSRGSFGAC